MLRNAFKFKARQEDNNSVFKCSAENEVAGRVESVESTSIHVHVLCECKQVISVGCGDGG